MCPKCSADMYYSMFEANIFKNATLESKCKSCGVDLKIIFRPMVRLVAIVQNDNYYQPTVRDHFTGQGDY